MRQLTVYEQFGCINMRAETLSFVDQSSSRGLKKFGEKIPTSPISPGGLFINRSYERYRAYATSYIFERIQQTVRT